MTKTASQHSREELIAGAEGFVAALKAFSQAAHDLECAYEWEFPDCDDKILDAYPFKESFDDLNCAISEWYAVAEERAAVYIAGLRAAAPAEVADAIQGATFEFPGFIALDVHGAGHRTRVLYFGQGGWHGEIYASPECTEEGCQPSHVFDLGVPEDCPDKALIVARVAEVVKAIEGIALDTIEKYECNGIEIHFRRR